MINKDGVCSFCYREYDLAWEAEELGDKGLKEGSQCPDEDCPSNE
ncbi:TPA: hypothetical protein ACPVZG_004118 [Vibrio parahaemolyticus]